MMYTWLDGKCYATSSNEEMQSPCISGKYCFVDLSQRDFLSQTMYIHKLINLLYYLLFLLFVVCVGFSLAVFLVLNKQQPILLMSFHLTE